MSQVTIRKLSDLSQSVIARADFPARFARVKGDIIVFSRTNAFDVGVFHIPSGTYRRVEPQGEVGFRCW